MQRERATAGIMLLVKLLALLVGSDVGLGVDSVPASVGEATGAGVGAGVKLPASRASTLRPLAQLLPTATESMLEQSKSTPEEPPGQATGVQLVHWTLSIARVHCSRHASIVDIREAIL